MLIGACNLDVVPNARLLAWALFRYHVALGLGLGHGAQAYTSPYILFLGVLDHDGVGAAGTFPPFFPFFFPT